MSKELEKVADATEAVVEEIKLAEEVKEIPESVNVEKVEVNVEEAPVAAVATVIKEEPKEDAGLKLLSESSLSEDQKKIASQIYLASKVAVHGTLSDASLNTAVKVTMVVGHIIKELASIKVGGSDKKAVAIEVGHILIKELVSDENHKNEILAIYDSVGEKTLETMIDVSKTINAVLSKGMHAAVEEASTQCCPGLLSFFKKSA